MLKSTENDLADEVFIAPIPISALLKEHISIFILIEKCIFLNLPVDQLCYQTIPASIFIHSTIVVNNIEFIINTKIYINNEYSGLFKLGYLPKTTNN